MATFIEELASTSDKELINRAQGLHDVIYVAECYGSKDMLRLDAIVRELEKRGYEVRGVSELVFKKVEGEEEALDELTLVCEGVAERLESYLDDDDLGIDSRVGELLDWQATRLRQAVSKARECRSNRFPWGVNRARVGDEVAD